MAEAKPGGRRSVAGYYWLVLATALRATLAFFRARLLFALILAGLAVLVNVALSPASVGTAAHNALVTLIVVVALVVAAFFVELVRTPVALHNAQASKGDARTLADMSDRGLGTRAIAVADKAWLWSVQRVRNHPGRQVGKLPGGGVGVIRTDPDPEYDAETMAEFKRLFGGDFMALFLEFERRGYMEMDDRAKWESPADQQAIHNLERWLSRLGKELQS